VLPVPEPALSVIIPAFNAADTIVEQLEAVLESAGTEPIEIVLVDNASTDETAAISRKMADADHRIRVLEEPRQGAPYAINTGIEAARSGYLAFCDADDVVGAGWVAAAIDALSGSPLVTGPLELFRLNPEALAQSRSTAWAGRLETFAGVFAMIPSGNFAARRETLAEIGPFNPEVAIGYDIDFAYRAFSLGITPSFSPDLELHYRYRSGPGSLWKQGVAMGRVQPFIARRVLNDGHQIPQWIPGLKRWIWLIKTVPRLSKAPMRQRWIWVASTSVGRLRGSWAARCISL